MHAREAALELLGALRVMRLRFEVESTSRFWLPDWPGSMLRGALGTCLKALETESSDAYLKLYRDQGPLDGRAGDAETDTPRPYLIEWATTTGRVLQAGDRFEFDVVLIGRAIDHAAQVTGAVAHAVEQGLGTQRVPHRLVSVRFVEGGARGTALGALASELPAELGTRVELVAVTPLALNREPALARRPTAEMLFMAALRRLRQVAGAHGDQPVSPYRIENDLRGRLDDVRLDTSRMCWINSERDSRTASRKVPLGGLVGPFTLEGHLEPLRPLLHAMLVLHAGRQVSQGFGRVVARLPKWETTTARPAIVHAAHPRDISATSC